MAKQHAWFQQRHDSHAHAILLEKSLIAALIFCHVLVFAARFITIPGLSLPSEKQLEPRAVTLEEIEIIKAQPSRPHAVRVEQPVVIADPVPEVLTSPIKPVPEPPRRHTAETVRLDLQEQVDVDISGRPSLDLKLPNERSARRRHAAEPEFGLDIHRSIEGPAYVAAAPELALDDNKTPSPARQGDAPTTLHLDEPVVLERPQVSQNDSEERVLLGDLLQADAVLVLAPDNLSMGEEEYQLWNRINAEFDRWDKGRYGALPAALTRRGRALIARFGIGSVRYTAVWLRGNTKVYVSGGASDDRLQELRQTLKGLIQLNLQRRGNE